MPWTRKLDKESLVATAPTRVRGQGPRLVGPAGAASAASSAPKGPKPGRERKRTPGSDWANEVKVTKLMKKGAARYGVSLLP